MQRVFDPKCRPEEYQQQGKSYPFPDLTQELCPQCLSDLLKRHGFYSRWLCAIGFSGEIRIRRFLCKTCGKTVSLLPSFAHPRMSHSILFIIVVLSRFYLDEASVTQALKIFYQDTGQCCSRQLLGQFRKRFQENLNRLIMEIIALMRLKSPLVTAPVEKQRQRARQLLEYIQSLNSEDVSLKLFELSRTTYLTAIAN